MSDYPPKGIEKAVIGRIWKVAESLRRKFDETFWRLDHHFAREGVRTNNTGRAHTIVSLNRELRAEIADFRLKRDKMQIYVDQLESLLPLLDLFEICPKCAGEQGEDSKTYMGYEWHDCSHCEGRGMLPVETAEVA